VDLADTAPARVLRLTWRQIVDVPNATLAHVVRGLGA
jgi:hypothetical protein